MSYLSADLFYVMCYFTSRRVVHFPQPVACWVAFGQSWYPLRFDNVIKTHIRRCCSQTDSMYNAGGMLGGAVDRFKVVMSGKDRVKMSTMVGGGLSALLLLWWLIPLL